MKRLTRLVSLAALGAIVLPAVLFFAGQMELDAAKGWMLAATAVWFLATPFWMDSSR